MEGKNGLQKLSSDLRVCVSVYTRVGAHMRMHTTQIRNENNFTYLYIIISYYELLNFSLRVLEQSKGQKSSMISSLNTLGLGNVWAAAG